MSNLDVAAHLSFVQGPVTLDGANAILLTSLAALTETLTVGQGGAVAFPGLNQVGDVVLAATTTITSIDFSSCCYWRSNYTNSTWYLTFKC